MISIDKKNNFTIFKVTGEVTADEILMQLAHYINGERTDTAIWDFTGTANVKITTVEMKGIADNLKKFSNDEKARRVALVGLKKPSTSAWASSLPLSPQWPDYPTRIKSFAIWIMPFNGWNVARTTIRNVASGEFTSDSTNIHHINQEMLADMPYKEKAAIANLDTSDVFYLQ